MHKACWLIGLVMFMGTGCSGQFDASSQVQSTSQPVAGLATPQTVLGEAHQVSAGGDTQLAGMDYLAADGLWGNVAEIESAALFSPDQSGGTETLAESAFAIYAFELPGYDGVAQLALNWDTTPATSNLYIGLADFDNNRWLWFQTGDPALLNFGTLPPYFSGTGIFLTAVLLTGMDMAQLASVRVGEAIDMPEAVLAADVLSGTAPLTVQFDASGSTDPGTGITQYEWDWDGDGTYDENTGTTATASHVFETAVNHTVMLRVTGSGGAMDTESVVIVTGDAAGWHMTVVSPGTIWVGHILWDVNGFPGVVYLDGYSIAYCRALDARGETWGQPVVLETIEDHSFTTCYAAMVASRPAAAWFRHTEASALSSIALHVSLAQDATGADWSTPVIVAGDLHYSESDSLGLVDAGGYPAVGYTSNWTAMFQRAADAAGTTWDAPVAVAESNADCINPVVLVDGRPAYAIVDSSADPNGDEVHYVLASDAAGTSFAAPAIAVPRQLSSIDTISLADVNGLPAIAYNNRMFVIAGDTAGTSWDSPVELYTGITTSYLMNIVNIAGSPAVISVEWFPYNSGEIFYTRANDQGATSWPVVQLVDSIEHTSPTYPFSKIGVGTLDGLQAVYYGGAATPLTIAVYE